MGESDMPKMTNRHGRMEIGWTWVGNQKKLYVQEGNVRQYYGTLMSAKADKFLEALKRWDEAGGNDNGKE